jgi:CRP-like cAMP-binding protein
MALVDRSPRSATVRARSETRLMSLSRKAFYGLVRTEPVLSSKLLWSFVQVLSHRLRATNEALSDARSETAPFAEIDDLRMDAVRLGTAEAGSAEVADGRAGNGGAGGKESPSSGQGAKP